MQSRTKEGEVSNYEVDMIKRDGFNAKEYSSLREEVGVDTYHNLEGN